MAVTLKVMIQDFQARDVTSDFLKGDDCRTFKVMAVSS